MIKYKNEYEKRNGIMSIVIDSPKYGEIVSYIDAEDIPIIDKYKWHAIYQKSVNGFYITCSNGNNQTIRLQRLITNCPDGMVVDHINRNTLDNRKANLKVCTQLENLYNRKVYSHSTPYKFFRMHIRKSTQKPSYDIAIPGYVRRQLKDLNEARAYYIECLLGYNIK